MAGSYGHVDENGKFRGIDLLDNIGDALEAIEEMYYMIQWLSGGDPEKIRLAEREAQRLAREAMTTPPRRCVPECWQMPPCERCHKPKKPRGRSAPLEMANGLCDQDCAGYDEQPKPGHHWPKEECDDNCA